jgi:hypothetical protein
MAFRSRLEQTDNRDGGANPSSRKHFKIDGIDIHASDVLACHLRWETSAGDAIDGFLARTVSGKNAASGSPPRACC